MLPPKQTIRALGVFLIILTAGVIFTSINYAVKSLSFLKQSELIFAASLPKDFLTFPKYTLAAGFIFQIIYGALFFFCGIGLLRLKKWSRKLLLVIFNLSILLLIPRFVLIGFIGINTPRYLGHLSYLIFIWAFLNSREIKDFFLLSETEEKKEKLNYIILMGMILLTVLSYALFIKIRIAPGLDIFYKPKKIVLTPAKISGDFAERQLGDLRFNLPRDYKNVSFYKMPSGAILAFGDKNSALRLLVTINDNVFHMMQPVFKSIF